MARSKDPSMMRDKWRFGRKYTICMLDEFTGEVLAEGPKISLSESIDMNETLTPDDMGIVVRVLPLGVKKPKGQRWDLERGRWVPKKSKKELKREQKARKQAAERKQEEQGKPLQPYSGPAIEIPVYVVELTDGHCRVFTDRASANGYSRTGGVIREAVAIVNPQSYQEPKLGFFKKQDNDSQAQ